MRRRPATTSARRPPTCGRPGIAISGSAAADTAAIGTLLIPMMRSAGYDVPRASGLIAAGGVIAPVIPPSIGFIMFLLGHAVVTMLMHYINTNSITGLAVVLGASLLVLAVPSFFLLLSRDQRRWLLTGGLAVVSPR